MVNPQNNSEDDELFDEMLDKIIGELTFIGQEDTEVPKQAECATERKRQKRRRRRRRRRKARKECKQKGYDRLSIISQLPDHQNAIQKIKKYNTERETWEVRVKMQDDQLEQHGAASTHGANF